MTTAPSPNFAYLAHHDPKLVAIATQAEVLFPVAPVATLAALRAFGELLAKRAAAKLNLLAVRQPGQYPETQQQLVDRLYDKGAINGQQRSLFHDLRRAGNEAAHDWEGERRMALHQLQMARELGVWFQRAFGNFCITNGYFWAWADNYRDAIDILKEWGAVRASVTV